MGDKKEENINQQIYLGEEVYNSIRFIITALRELQMISIGNGHYFTAVQLMSAGIERLLKIPQFKCSYRSYKELY